MPDNVIDLNDDQTRLFELPDGTKRLVHGDELFWFNVRFLYVIEGYTEAQLSAWALEEVKLQGLGFNDAMHTVVGYLGNQDKYWPQEEPAN